MAADVASVCRPRGGSNGEACHGADFYQELGIGGVSGASNSNHDAGKASGGPCHERDASASVRGIMGRALASGAAVMHEPGTGGLTRSEVPSGGAGELPLDDAPASLRHMTTDAASLHDSRGGTTGVAHHGACLYQDIGIGGLCGANNGSHNAGYSSSSPRPKQRSSASEGALDSDASDHDQAALATAARGADVEAWAQRRWLKILEARSRFSEVGPRGDDDSGSWPVFSGGGEISSGPCTQQLTSSRKDVFLRVPGPVASADDCRAWLPRMLLRWACCTSEGRRAV